MSKKIVELYGGDVKLEFKDKPYHSYKLIKPEKEKPLSNTQITGVVDKSGPLMHWASKTDIERAIEQLEKRKGTSLTVQEAIDMVSDSQGYFRKARDKAASIGSMVHDFAEKFAKAKVEGTEEPELPNNEEALNGINAFLDWYNENDVEFLKYERIAYSMEYNYVGTFDIVAKINGDLVLGDYKTSSGVYSDHYYQVAGYFHSYNEEMEYIGEEKADKVMILHFNKKNGEFDIHEVSEEEMEKDLEAFKAAQILKTREKERS